MTEEQSFSMPTPGEHHEKLKPFEGTFRSEVTLWFGPDQSQQSTGTMTSSWHLGGLYLHQDYIGDENDGPFSPFIGKGYWGFNTFANEYQGFWIDNASTMMQIETGNVDEEGKVWTMLSEVPNPHGGGMMKKKSVITLISQDHHKLEAFIETPDGEFRNMEINYTRA